MDRRGQHGDGGAGCDPLANAGVGVWSDPCGLDFGFCGHGATHSGSVARSLAGGATGLGKAPIASLISWLYNVTSGAVLIGGLDVRDANHICVPSEGRIVERGTHAQLLAEGEVVRSLYERQFLV